MWLRFSEYFNSIGHQLLWASHTTRSVGCKLDKVYFSSWTTVIRKNVEFRKCCLPKQRMRASGYVTHSTSRIRNKLAVDWIRMVRKAWSGSLYMNFISNQTEWGLPIEICYCSNCCSFLFSPIGSILRKYNKKPFSSFTSFNEDF